MAAKRIRLIAKRPIVIEEICTTFEYPFESREVRVTRTAWQCRLCKKWEEFTCITLDGRTNVAKGCGGQSHFFDGHRIDHCFDCSAKANVMMGIGT